MSKKVISSHAEFEQFIGKEMGVSEYLKISQEQINKFAEATLDFQWIHTNPEKAATESPFKSTIAHGYLTLSVLPYLWDQIAEFRNVKMLVNYGIESFRFSQAVLVNSEVRLKATLVSLVNLRGVSKAQVNVVLEIKDSKKPAYDGNVVFLYHFNA